MGGYHDPWSVKVSDSRKAKDGLKIYIPRLLPLRPIWIGVAVNTVFYAALLWLLLTASLRTRRLIRKRRGECVRCGYDLRGTTDIICSECGHEIRAEAGI